MSTETGKPRSVRPLVAVELGSDWLKVVQAEQSRAGLRILRMARAENSASLLSSKDASSALAEAIKTFKFTGPVIGCLPRRSVTIRMLELPSTDPAEIADMMELQAGKQTPYSKEEIVSDYTLVGAAREGYTNVMLAIVQRSLLRHRFSVFEEAGVEIERMSVSTEGVLHWFRQGVPGDLAGSTVAVLDIDSACSDFMVVSRGMLVFTRSILVGAEALFDDERARERFGREVVNSLAACRGESPSLAVGSLLVTGAGARVEGLPSYLGEQLNLQAVERDGLESVSEMPRAPSLKEPEFRSLSITPLLGIAVASGQLEIDLVPDTVRLRKQLTVKARKLAALAALIMTALVAASLYATSRLWFKIARLKGIEKRITALSPIVDEVERKMEIIKIMRRRRDFSDSALNLLAEVHRQLSDEADIALEGMELDVRKGQLAVAGTGGSTRDISNLARGLETSRLFGQVQESGTSMARNRRYKFRIVAELERDG
ncbi:pilus assembly protein PilM [Verrucomicrobiota bacterium]